MEPVIEEMNDPDEAMGGGLVRCFIYWCCGFAVE